MGDSMSMLDFGIYRMQAALGSAGGGLVWFDWDANRIMVTRYFTSDAWEAGEKSCGDWIAEVRNVAGLRTDGTTYGEASAFASLFTHYGFERSPPENLLPSIDGIIILDCTSSIYDPASNYLGYMEASAPLLGSGYSVKKTPVVAPDVKSP